MGGVRVRMRVWVRMRTAASLSPAHRCCCVSCATVSSSSVTRSTTGVAAGTPRPSVAIANAASSVVCSRIAAFTPPIVLASRLRPDLWASAASSMLLILPAGRALCPLRRWWAARWEAVGGVVGGGCGRWWPLSLW